MVERNFSSLLVERIVSSGQEIAELQNDWSLHLITALVISLYWVCDSLFPELKRRLPFLLEMLKHFIFGKTGEWDEMAQPQDEPIFDPELPAAASRCGSSSHETARPLLLDLCNVLWVLEWTDLLCLLIKHAAWFFFPNTTQERYISSEPTRQELLLGLLSLLSIPVITKLVQSGDYLRHYSFGSWSNKKVLTVAVVQHTATRFLPLVLRLRDDMVLSCSFVGARVGSGATMLDSTVHVDHHSHGRTLLYTDHHLQGRDNLPAHERLSTAVLIASSAFVVICCIALVLCCKCWEKSVQQPEQVQEDPVAQLELSSAAMAPRQFQYHELAVATNKFCGDNKLGRGGFGLVYRGYLSDRDLHVAIKVSSKQSSGQGRKEFEAEVKVMTRLRHRNIVHLVGWCKGKEQLLLVYELMAEGSLDKHLYSPDKMLTWQQRYKIILDLGSAVLYLHKDCDKCIVHGDIKPANVLLDASYHAKLGDFGIARPIDHGAEPQTTQNVAGTHGYMDPELLANGLRCSEADVYSFGVVLLEIGCGQQPASRLPYGGLGLLAWVRHLHDRSRILDVADKRLNGEFDMPEMERVLVTALWCAHQDPSRRPSIAQAMDVLRSADAKLPVLPAMRDAQRIRSIREQAYGNLPVAEDPYHAGAITTTTYLTSMESAYLLAQG